MRKMRKVNGVLVEHTVNGVNQLNNEKPAALTMAKGAVGALGAVIRHGVKQVSDEEKARRLEICNGCEFLVRKEGKSDRCAKCGCFLKWKTALEAWHCPIGRW